MILQFCRIPSGVSYPLHSSNDFHIDSIDEKQKGDGQVTPTAHVSADYHDFTIVVSFVVILFFIILVLCITLI